MITISYKTSISRAVPQTHTPAKADPYGTSPVTVLYLVDLIPKLLFYANLFI